MYILAQTTPGKEYFYDARTAHAVSKASAEKICDIVNKYKHVIGTPAGRTWHVYTISEYDIAADYARFQKFTIRRGVVTARHY